MTTARAIAKVIVDQYPDSAMSLVLEVVRLVSDEQVQRATRKPVLLVPTPDTDTPSKIVATVCAHYEVSERVLRGRDKHRHAAIARSMCWLLLRTRLKQSYQELGDLFDRDHTTVMTALQRLKPDPEELATLTRRLDEANGRVRAVEAAE